MSSILNLIPVVHSLPCGGATVKVSELRLRDLARLQAILDSREVDPFTVIEAELETAAPDRRRQLIRDAWDRAESGPVLYGSPEAKAYFATTEGFALFLWVACRRSRLTPIQAAELACKVSGPELGRIYRIAHGITPLAALEKYAFAPDLLPVAPQGSGMDWPQAIDELAIRFQCRYKDIYNMTITEWVVARHGGKLPEIGIAIPPGADLKEIARKQREWLYGDSVNEGEA